MGDLQFALQVVIVGFGTVLFTLFLLYLIITLLGRVLGRREELTQQQELAPKVKPLDTPSPQIIAAITAALNSYLATSYPGQTYQITQIEKISSKETNSWKKQGIKEMLYRREELESLRREKHGEKSI